MLRLHPIDRMLMLLVLIAIAPMAALASGTVQLELVGDTHGSAMAFQQWAMVLGNAGIRNVRIRTAEDAETVGIETLGTAQNPTYVVTGVIRSADELVLPGGRYRRADIGRLTEWLTDLAEHGPAAGREPKGPFGLTKAAFAKVHLDLATPVGFATHNMARRQVVGRIVAQLKLPVKLDAATTEAIGDDKLAEELSDLTSGTSLAYVLGLAGYGFVPRDAAGQLSYDVVRLERDVDAWPAGWTSEKLPRERLPGLFEFLNVNIENVTAARALDAIAKRLKTPVLVDHRALQRNGIDPATKKVTLPKSRTTYSLALRQVLFQARMKFEVRYDEIDTPLLWITSIKP